MESKTKNNKQSKTYKKPSNSKPKNTKNTNKTQKSKSITTKKPTTKTENTKINKNYKSPTKNSLNAKLDLIIKNQQKILENEKKILQKEDELEQLEIQDLAQDTKVSQTEEETLLELERIEKKINSSISKPLKLVTKRDIFKGFIGAFLGVMGHFAFSKGSELAKTLSFYQATTLYIVAAIIITIMLYYTGFRKIEKQIIFKFMPLRAITLYSVSVFTIILVNFLFGKIHFPVEFMEIYKVVAANIILAVMGAGTADLLGKVEEH